MTVKFKSKASIKTKQMIWNEFANLLYEWGDVKRITVTEICKRIGINRVTFYSYYKSVNEISEDIKSDILNNFFTKWVINDTNDIVDFFDKIEAYILKHQECFSKLVYSKNIMNFAYNNLANISAQRITNYFLDHADARIMDWVELDIYLFNSGLISLLIQYLKGKTAKPLRQIIKFCKEITLHEIKSMQNKEHLDRLLELNKKINE